MGRYHDDVMTFAPGDDVQVAALGKGVVREVRNGGRYLVELRGRSIVATETQLTAASPRKREPSSGAHASKAGGPDSQAHSSASTSLDLHGMTVEEAVAALDGFLNDALLAGHAEVRVIHGRSGGRLKAAVHARLKQLRGVRATRLDPANPGVTIVTL
jgi:DNA mismatch repair protein MutS2